MMSTVSVRPSQVSATKLISYDDLPRQSAQYYVVGFGTIGRSYQLRQPFLVSVEKDDGDSLIVSDAIVDVYGVGESVNEAMEDYVKNLVDYFEVLECEAARFQLSEHLREHLIYLRSVITKPH